MPHGFNIWFFSTRSSLLVPFLTLLVRYILAPTLAVSSTGNGAERGGGGLLLADRRRLVRQRLLASGALTVSWWLVVGGAAGLAVAAAEAGAATAVAVSCEVIGGLTGCLMRSATVCCNATGNCLIISCATFART